MSPTRTSTRFLILRLLGALMLVLAPFGSLFAADRQFVSSDDLRILGVALRAEPATQTIPIGVPTGVRLLLVAAGDPTHVVPVGDLPADMVIRATLEPPPGLGSAIELAAAPGTRLGIPALAAEGIYHVVNIRLMQGETVLMVADPVKVVVGQILVTSVTSRVLSLDEVRDLGIVLDAASFKVMDFNITLGLSTGDVQIRIPALVPLNGGPIFALPPAMSPLAIGPLAAGPGIGKSHQEAFEVVPFELAAGERGEPKVSGLSLSGAVVLPQSVGFLRQFHSIVLMVTNAAADTSALAVRDLEASFTLPAGLVRKKSIPLTVGDAAVPVRVPGADGKLGTADDLNVIAAGLTASSELVTQGMEEGTHRIDIELAGTVTGLPDGDAPISGHASGIVLVRNPNFNLTFLVPSVVEAGREFELATVITNTSDLVANLVSIRLPASSAAGARLLSDELQTFETIEPGESVTARYRLQALRSGAISATRFGSASDGLEGRFQLIVAVNEDGFPRSPDVIHLPDEAYQLPRSLVDALLSFLGSMWSNATAPVGGLAPGTPQVGREAVRRAAMQIADAGQRQAMGESPGSVLTNLWMRFGGAENADPTLDLLRRGSLRWPEARTALAAELAAELATAGGSSAGDLARLAAREHFYDAPFVYAGVDSRAAARASLLVVDLEMRRLGGVDADSAIPGGDLMTVGSNGQLAQLTTPEGVYTVVVEGLEEGLHDITLIVPYAPLGGEPRLREVTFDGVELEPGERVSITISPLTSTYEFVRVGVDPRVAIASTSVVDLVPLPLALRSARVAPSIDPGLHVVALLFNRPVDEESAERLTSYRFVGEAMDEQAVTAVQVQAAGRFVYLSLRNPVPPEPTSSIRVTGVGDADGGAPPVSERAIEVPPIGDAWGTVVGRVLAGDGRPIAGQQVLLSEQVATTFGGAVAARTTAIATTDGSGSYRFYFARRTGFALTVAAWDARGEKAESIATLRADRQELELDLRYLGRGTVIGRVVMSGEAVDGALVTGVGRRPGDDTDDFVQAWSDSRGRFTLENLPVGTINLSVKTWSGLFAARSLLISEAGARVEVGDIQLTPIAAGRVSGRVLVDGVPVAGAVVTIINSDAFAPDSWGTWTTTAVDGSYAFTGVPVGRITVKRHVGPTEPQCSVGSGLLTDTDDGRDLHLDIFCPGARSGTGTVNGLLLNSGGQPLGGWSVALAGKSPQTSEVGTGRFQFTEVPLGYGDVVASAPAPDGRRMEDSYQLSYVGQTHSLILRLPAVGTLNFVVSHDGVAAAGAVVAIRQSTLPECTTDSAGRCSISGVGIGGYVADVVGSAPGSGDPPKPVGAVASAKLRFDDDEQEVAVMLPSLHTLSGSVHDASGEPVDGVRVYLDELGIEDGQLTTINLRSTPVADGSGSFSFENVMAGRFHLLARDSLGAAPPAEADGILGPGTGSVDLVLGATPPQVTLAIHVVRPDGSELVVVPGELVIKVTPLGQPTRDLTSNPTEASFPAGSYAIDVTYTPVGGLEQRASIVGSAHSDTAVTVRLNGHGVVRGVVRTSDGHPVDPVDLPATVSLRSYTPGLSPEESPSITLVSADAGVFEFTGVREGVIHVEAHYAGNGGASSATLAAGGVSEIDVTFGPIGTITGTVFNPDGTTRADAGLSIVVKTWSRDRGWYSIDGAVTDGDGGFTVGPVPIGGRSYRVVATDQTTGRSASVDLRPAAPPVSPVRLQLGGTGAVRGFVFEADGVSPIVGTNVELQSGSSHPEAGARTLLTSVDPASGYYRFDGVPEGAFSEQAPKPSTELAARGAGRVGPGETVHTDLVLQPHGDVTGRVWSEGSPVPGATVRLDYPGCVSNCRAWVTQDTDIDGRFSFDHVPLGVYPLTVETHPVDSLPDRGWASGELTVQGQVGYHDIVLVGFAELTVNVVDGAGDPLTADYQVTVDTDGQSILCSLPLAPCEFTRVRRGLVQVSGRMAVGTDESNTSSASTLIPPEVDEATITLQVSAIADLHGIVLGVDGVPVGEDQAFVHLTVDPGGTRQVEHYTVRTTTGGRFDFVKVVAEGDLVIDVEPIVGSARARASHGWASVPTDLTLRLDATPAILIRSTPADGDIEVPTTAPLVLTFNEPMDAASFAPARGNVVIDGYEPTSVVVDGAMVTVTGVLTASRSYTLLIRGTAENANGLPLGVDRAVSFMTVDQAAPTAVLESPLHRATSVPIATPVTVRFSERMDADTLRGLTIDCGGRFSLDGTGTLATRVGPPDLPSDATCVVQATSTLRDSHGNPLAAADFDFTTEDTIAPGLGSLEVTDPVGVTAYLEGASIQVQATSTATDLRRIDYFVGTAVVSATAATSFAATVIVPTITAAGGEQFTVVAVASDDVGNRSEPVQSVLAIQADAPPTISIVKPVDGDRFAIGKNVPIEIRATDSVGLTAIGYQVDQDGLGLGSGNASYTPIPGPRTATFSFTAPAVFESGDIWVTASATDSVGQTTSSAPIKVSLLETAYKGIVRLPGGGGPAEGAVVTFRDLGGPDSFDEETDGDGHYELGVTGTSHRVNVEQTDTGRRALVASVTAVVGEVTELDPIELGPGGSIDFNITASGAAPQGSVTISIFTPYGTLTSDHSEGSEYRVDKVPLDFRSVQVRSLATGYAANWFRVDSYLDQATVDLTVELPAPEIHTVSPSIVPANREYTLEVSGNHLHSDASVLIDGDEQRTTRGAGRLYVALDPRSPGEFKIVVRNPDGGVAESERILVKARTLGQMAATVAASDLAARDGRVYVVRNGFHDYALDAPGDKLVLRDTKLAGTWFNHLALAGDWAFAAGSSRVQLLRVSGAAVPEPIAESPDLGGTVTDLIAAGTREAWALVGQRMIRLTVDDETVPSQLVAHLETPIHLGIAATRARLVGRRLYVASAPTDRVGGIRIFDVTEPDRPTLLGEHPGQYTALVVSGDRVIAATAQPPHPAKPRLELLDVSQPGAITVVLATSELPLPATDLVVSRGRVFVADGSTSVPNYKYGDAGVTDPDSLDLGTGAVRSLLVDGSILYAGTDSGIHGFEPFDFVRTPQPLLVARGAAPTGGGTEFIVAGDDLVAGTDTEVTVGDLHATATDLFVGDGWLSAKAPGGDAGLATIKVTNPTGHFGEFVDGFEYTPEPRLFGFAPAADSALGGKRLRVDGINLESASVEINGVPVVISAGEFIAPGGSAVGSYEVQITGQPAIAQRFRSTVAKYDFEREGPLVNGSDEIAVRGNPDGSIDIASWWPWPGSIGTEFFHLGGDGLVSDAGTVAGRLRGFHRDLLVVGTTFVDEFWGGRVRFEGDRMYTEDYGCVYDVADPTAVVRLGCLYRDLGDFVVDNGWVYRFVGDTDRFEVYDFTNPGYPHRVQDFSAGGVSGSMTVSGGRAYFASGDKIYSLDLPRNATPVTPTGFAAPSGITLSPAAPAISGNEVFAITTDGDLQGFTGVGTATLTPSSSFEDGQVVALRAVGGLLFAARGHGKVRVYETDVRESTPVITSLSASTGSAGIVVDVLGHSFVDGAMVLFGAGEADGIAFINPGRIRVRVPAGSGSDVPVKVRNPDGRESNGVGFTYTAEVPTITSVFPTSAPMLGGPSVTLRGFGLGGVTQVRVEQEGAPASVVDVSATDTTDTSVTFTIPIAPARHRGEVRLVALVGPSPAASISFYYAEDVITGGRGPTLRILACGQTLFTTAGSTSSTTFDLLQLEGDAPALQSIASFTTDGSFLHCHGGDGITATKIRSADGVTRQESLPVRINAGSSIVVGDRLFTHDNVNLSTYNLGDLARPAELLPDVPCYRGFSDAGPERMLAERDRLVIGCENSAHVYDLSGAVPSPLGSTPNRYDCEGDYGLTSLVGFEERAVYTTSGVFDLSIPLSPQPVASIDLPAQECSGNPQWNHDRTPLTWSDDRTQLFTKSGSRLIEVRTRNLATPYTYDFKEAILAPVPFDRFLVYGDYIILDNGPTVIRLDGRAPALTITSLQPAAGPIAGGQTVIIRGHDLDQATAVNFGGTVFTSGEFRVLSPGSLELVTPAHALGVVTVVVESADAGSASIQYRYAITAVSVTVVSPVFIHPQVTVELDGEPGASPVTASLNGVAATVVEVEVVGDTVTVTLGFPRIDHLGPAVLAILVGSENVIDLPLVALAPWAYELPANKEYAEAAFAVDGRLLVSSASQFTVPGEETPSLTAFNASDLEHVAWVADSGTSVVGGGYYESLAVDREFAMTMANGLDAAIFDVTGAPLLELKGSIASAVYPNDLILVGDHAISLGYGLKVDKIDRVPFGLTPRLHSEEVMLVASSSHWRDGHLIGGGYNYGGGTGPTPPILKLSLDLDGADPLAVDVEASWGNDSGYAANLGVYGDRLYSVVADWVSGLTEFVVLNSSTLELISRTDLADEPVSWGHRGMVRSSLTIAGARREVIWIASSARLLPIDVTDPESPTILSAVALTTSGRSSAITARDGILFSLEEGRRIRGYPLGTNEVELLGVYPPSGPVGQLISISGAGFDPDSTVTIGGLDALEIQVVDQNQILCRPPAGIVAGEHEVRVLVGSRIGEGKTYAIP